MTHRDLALIGMRRMISRLDRRPWSPTYGCFDREFWHYKTLIEFPRANFQQCVWGLAVLYKTPFEGNEFAGKPEVLEWIRAALAFWRGMRHRDGSVDEWYQNERSFCATAFNAAAVGETLVLLRDEFDAEFCSQMIGALAATVGWLRVRPNTTVANQMIAALVAFDALRLLDGQHGAACAEWLQQTLGLQHAEGWFPEYGGADIGYGMLALDLLAHLWRRTRDVGLERAVESLLDFLSYFLQPDGTIGGEYSSRSTNHCFLYGLEILAAEGRASARGMALRLRGNVRAPNVLTTDDTYAAYFYFNSTCLAAATPVTAAPAGLSMRSKDFPGAGLVVRSNEHYHAVINVQRGVWWVVGHDGRVCGDAGFVAATDGGKLWTSARAELHAPNVTTDRVVVSKTFSSLDAKLPLVRHVAAFKMFTKYVLHFPALATRFSSWVKQRKIHTSRIGALKLSRTWRFTAEAIEVVDVLPAGIRTAWLAQEGSGMHSPSGMQAGQTFLTDRQIKVDGTYQRRFDFSRHRPCATETADE